MNRALSRFGYTIYLGAMLVVIVVCSGLAAAQEQSAADSPLASIKVLDLATAAKIALSENPSLAAARARVQQASQVVRQARSSYWPRLDAGAGYSRVDLSDNAFQSQQALTQAMQAMGIPATLNDPEDYYTADLTASWLVFDGFARKFNLAAARYGEKSTTEARNDTQRLLLSAVTFAFLEAQLALENISITKADEAFNQRQYTEANLRYEVGTGALSDVLNFQVRVNNARTERILDERDYKSARIRLAALLGLPQGRLPNHIELAPLIPTTSEELGAPQAAELLEKAFALRPDLQQSEWMVHQAEAGVKTAQAGYYPSINLSATWDGERTEDAGFESEDFGNTVALGLTWNIFAGGLTRAKTAEAKAKLYAVEKERQDAKVKVASEVQKVVTRIDTAQEQLALQESNTKLVQQQRGLVEKEYKAGVGSLGRLNEAQRDLTVAQGRLAFARVALREAWYDLQTATGQIVATFKP